MCPRGDVSGSNPRGLDAGDMTAICHAFHGAVDARTRAAYSPSHRRSLTGWWRRLIDFSRTAGLVDAIPGRCSVRPDHAGNPAIRAGTN